MTLSVRNLIKLIDALHDDTECRLDHHGYCQTHSLDEPPCPHSEARKVLEEWRKREAASNARKKLKRIKDKL